MYNSLGMYLEGRKEGGGRKEARQKCHGRKKAHI
jgi:hypothetical protein